MILLWSENINKLHFGQGFGPWPQLLLYTGLLISHNYTKHYIYVKYVVVESDNVGSDPKVRPQCFIYKMA